jgi:prolyl oligopeptidase family protein
MQLTPLSVTLLSPRRRLCMGCLPYGLPIRCLPMGSDGVRTCQGAQTRGPHPLHEMDAVYHVRPGTRYPAVLLTAGINDSRVEAWQLAKVAAVLQERSASAYPMVLGVAFDAGHGMALTKPNGSRRPPTSTPSSCGSSWERGQPAP